MSDDERDVDPSKDTETVVLDTAGEEPDEELDNYADDDAAGELENYADDPAGEVDPEIEDISDEVGPDDPADEPETEIHPVEPAKPKRNWRSDIWRRQITVKPVPAILTLLVLISGGATGWLYFKYHQPDQRTSPSVSRAAINAASDGTVALLSYSPDSLDKDFATARSHLTGDFLSYYDQFTQQIVAPAAKQKSLKTSAHVMRAAVQELHPDTAVVLVFVDQSTTSKDNPEPSMAASSVLVNMALVDGKWLITKFTPV